MKCKFSKSRNKDDGPIRLNSQEIPKNVSFGYLGSIIHKNGEIEKKQNHRIKERWMKWKSESRFLCDYKIPIFVTNGNKI